MSRVVLTGTGLMEPRRRDRKALGLGGAAILVAGLVLYCAGIVDPFRPAPAPSPFEFPVLHIKPPEAAADSGQ